MPGSVLKAISPVRELLLKRTTCEPLHSSRTTFREYRPFSPGARPAGSTLASRRSTPPSPRRFNSISTIKSLSVSLEVFCTVPPITACGGLHTGSSAKICTEAALAVLKISCRVFVPLSVAAVCDSGFLQQPASATNNKEQKSAGNVARFNDFCRRVSYVKSLRR